MVLLGSGSVRYDATVHNHLHTRCQIRGQVRDVPPNLGQKILAEVPKHLLAQIESEMDFRINHVQIQLVGQSP